MRESGLYPRRRAVNATAVRDHYDRSNERDLMEHRRNEVTKLAF